MKLDTYVYLPGQTTRQEMLDRTLWLPDLQQMWAAARLNVEDALDPAERKLIGVTMRQGIGMIAVLGLLAGLIPLIANLWLAIPMGTSVPLAQLADGAAQMIGVYTGNAPLEMTAHTVQTVAGLEPRMPGVLAALLSALGLWLNWPLSWLANWIVYGTIVYAAARIMGARHMLPAFLAATSFTAVPLLLTGLTPIPLVGPLLAMAGLILAFVLYFRIAAYVTGLDAGRTVICMLIPVAVAVLIPLLLAGLATLFYLSM